jgi:NAD(P) transhydrogenase subunit alpha
MSQVPSKFKVFGLVLLAMLIGGLLFAQDDDKAKADKPSPSDEKAATETPAEKEPAPREVATPKAKPLPATAVMEHKPNADAAQANWTRVIASLTVFVLAVFVGFEVITKVPPTLHTPLMSGSNAISGITLVGAVIVAASMSFSGFVGFLAVALATVNAVGGFLVTHRMLAMFKKR